MSKSLGNIIPPQEIVSQYGADILRLWVAQSDYTVDQRIGEKILKGVSDSYRRFRNTLRFLLGSLADFEEAERVPVDQMPELERWVLHRLSEVDGEIRTAYGQFDFQRVIQTLFQFATADLSSFYFDIRKDVLYCDGDTLERRAARTVLDLLFQHLTTWPAPILVFTMEEVWQHRYPGPDSSVHLVDMPPVPAEWRNGVLAQKWEMVRKARSVVTGALEVERQNKAIGSSLEAAPIVHVSADMADILATVPFADVCITSSVEVTTQGQGAFTLPDADSEGISVSFARAKGERCARCWKILPDVGSHRHPQTCERCNAALGG